MLPAIQPAKDSLNLLVILCAQFAVSAPKLSCSCCCGPCSSHSKNICSTPMVRSVIDAGNCTHRRISVYPN
ncbi:hypothetical protein BX661DRAFT_190869 [Kickxella alabastrina]|uniref:uncharacterized protein n=1 Tax=Kickxella alabastrina TaxID=61397 RepID=UPI00221FED01|nr:uncharacterized protein BX661DRAFT_190869 [Kickxella alabastrina]KAI7819036.1 hypothetical protein BX661DRAFT_190869 [Kickxella alabastrina]